MEQPKDSLAKLNDYLDDHVRYERTMLNHTFAELHRTVPGFAWNVVYEAYGVHARNLYDFLRHEGKKQTTFRADDYVEDRERPAALLAFNELDKFLFHMSVGRAEREKLELGRLYPLQDWIDKEW